MSPHPHSDLDRHPRTLAAPSSRADGSWSSSRYPHTARRPCYTGALGCLACSTVGDWDCPARHSGSARCTESSRGNPDRLRHIPPHETRYRTSRDRLWRECFDPSRSSTNPLVRRRPDCDTCKRHRSTCSARQCRNRCDRSLDGPAPSRNNRHRACPAADRARMRDSRTARSAVYRCCTPTRSWRNSDRCRALPRYTRRNTSASSGLSGATTEQSGPERPTRRPAPHLQRPMRPVGRRVKTCACKPLWQILPQNIETGNFFG